MPLSWRQHALQDFRHRQCVGSYAGRVILANSSMTWRDLLRIAEPRRYLLAMAFKNISEWVFYGAAGWIAASSLSSPTSVSVVMTASFVPTVPGSLLGGWLIDKKEPNLVLRLVLAFCVVPAAFLLAVNAAGWINMFSLYSAVFLQGSAAVVLNPVRWSSYQMVASDQNRPYLLGADTLQWEASRGAGIYIAGAGLAYYGVYAVLAAGICAAALSVLFAARLRMRRDSRRSDYTSVSFKEFLSGGKWIVRNRRKVLPFMLLGGFVWSAYAPLVYLLPSVASDMLSENSAGFGMLGGALGAGGAAGGVLSSWCRKIRNTKQAVSIAVICMASGMCILGSAGNLAVACIGTAVAASVPGSLWTVLYLEIAEHIEQDMKGRVFGAWGAVSYGLIMPAVLLLAGVSAGIFGLRSVLFGVGVFLVAVLWGISAWQRKNSRTAL